MTTHLRPIALVGVGLIAASLTFGSGVAFADDDSAPAPGTTACTSLIEDDPTYIAAATEARADNPNTPDQNNSALAYAQGEASDRLCTGTPSDPTTTDPTTTDPTTTDPTTTDPTTTDPTTTDPTTTDPTTTDPTTTDPTTTDPTTTDPTTTDPTTTPPADNGGSDTTTPPATVNVKPILAEVSSFNCHDGFAAQYGRITDQTAALVGKASNEQIGTVYDALDRKLHALNYCVGTATDAPPTTINIRATVNPTADDGSVVVHHTQVVEVPEGSVSTGGA